MLAAAAMTQGATDATTSGIEMSHTSVRAGMVQVSATKGTSSL